MSSAVVLNAQDGFFDRFTESSDAPVCPSMTATTGCVMVSRASAIRLNILGYTVTIPPVWLGGDSEDQYFADGSPVPWLDDGPWSFEAWTAAGRGRPFVVSADARTDGGDSTTSAQSQDQSRSGGEPGSTTIDAVSSAFSTPGEVFDPGALQFAAATGGRQERDWLFSPDAFLPATGSIDPPLPSLPALPDVPSTPAVPLFSDRTTFDGDAPEPSTWLMTIAGLAMIGVFKRRRILSALRQPA